MIIICDIADRKSALTCYIAVSIISLLIMPDKECALTYVFFFGFYPIIRDFIEKIKPKPLSYSVKLVIYNAGIIISQLLCFYVFAIPFEFSIVVLAIVFLFTIPPTFQTKQK